MPRGTKTSRSDKLRPCTQLATCPVAQGIEEAAGNALDLLQQFEASKRIFKVATAVLGCQAGCRPGKIWEVLFSKSIISGKQRQR